MRVTHIFSANGDYAGWRGKYEESPKEEYKIVKQTEDKLMVIFRKKVDKIYYRYADYRILEDKLLAAPIISSKEVEGWAIWKHAGTMDSDFSRQPATSSAAPTGRK